MPDNPFESAYPTPQQPRNTVNGASPAQAGSGANPFDSYQAPPNQAASTPEHGALYNFAEKTINAPKFESHLPYVGGAVDTMVNAPGDISRGAVKGVLSTAAGLGSIYNRFTKSNQPFSQSNLEPLTVSKSPGEAAGKFGEQMLEYGSGEGAVAKGVGKGLLGKIAASGAISGVQSGGDPTSTLMGATLPAVLSSPAAKAAGKMASEVLGKFAGEGAIARAFLHPDSSGLAKVMRGEWNVNDVGGHIQDAVTQFRDASSAQYSQRLNQIANTQIMGWPTKAGDFLTDMDYTLTNELKKFNVMQNADGSWNFKHLTGADPDDVKKLINTVYNWGSERKDMTPAGLDVLKKKLGEFAGQGGSMSALGSRLYDRANSRLNDIIPGYSQLTKDYAASSDLLRQIKSELSVAASGNINPGQLTRKIQNIFKQGSNNKELLLKKIPGGDDLLDQIAGLHLQHNLPKGVMGSLVGTETLFGMLHHPSLAAVPVTMMSSPRVIGEAARAGGKLAQSSIPVADTLRRGLLTSANQANLIPATQ